MRMCAFSLPAFLPACPPAKSAAAVRALRDHVCVPKNQTGWPIPGWILPPKDASKPGTEGAFVFLCPQKGQKMKESSGLCFCHSMLLFSFAY
jgi:hypothetical protein